MSRTTLSYDTFQALNSDCSLPLAASLQCLVRSVSCSLIHMRTLVNSSDLLRTSGTTGLYSHDVDESLIPAGDAISETIQRFSGILHQMDEAILNRIILLDAFQKHKDLVSVPPATRTLSFQRSTSATSQARKLTLQLSTNLKRVCSQLESFVYLTDNFLLASLADSARGDVLNDGLSKINHVQQEQTFNALIDDCVDVAQGSWSIRAQLAQAHAALSRTSSPTYNHNNGLLWLPFRPRNSTALRFKPKLRYEESGSLGRRLRHRSVQKFRPKNPTGVNRPIRWLAALIQPKSSLETIRAARYFLQNNP